MSRSTYLKISVTLLIVTTQTAAYADDWDPRPQSCFVDQVKKSLSERKEKIVNKLKKPVTSQEELERLSATQLASYFPDTEKSTIAGSSKISQRTEASAEQTDAFKKDWDALIQQRAGETAFDPYKLKKAVNGMGGSKGYPNLAPEYLDSYKSQGLTLSELQDQIVWDYNKKQKAERADYEGLKRDLMSANPYLIARGAMRWTKDHFIFPVKDSVKGGVFFAIAASLYKPVTDVYNRKFNAVTSKAIDKLPEHKELNDSIESNQKLAKEALAVDFVNMATQEERLHTWAELEKKFKKSHEVIRKNQLDIPSLKTPIEQNKKTLEPYLRANRVAYLTSLSQLSKETTPQATSTKALALGNLKAQEMKFPPSDTEVDLSNTVTDLVLRQIADDPAAFQQFVKEFVQTQKPVP
ncbi:MAG: hypothetical protein ACJ763_02765 [Bdellovibrionia bacterium]